VYVCATVTVTVADVAALYVESPASTASILQVPDVDEVVRVLPEIEHESDPERTLYVVEPADPALTEVVSAAVELMFTVALPSESPPTARVTVRRVLPVVNDLISP
jgi:hypothetical protein